MNTANLTITHINEGTILFRFCPSASLVEHGKGLITGRFGIFAYNPKYEKAKLLQKSYRHFLARRENGAKMDQDTIKFIRAIELKLAKLVNNIVAAHKDKAIGGWAINQDGTFVEANSMSADVGF